MLIKVATLLGVATFLRLCLSIFGRGGVTNSANIWSGGDYQEGVSPRSCLATTNFSPLKLK